MRSLLSYLFIASMVFTTCTKKHEGQLVGTTWKMNASMTNLTSSAFPAVWQDYNGTPQLLRFRIDGRLEHDGGFLSGSVDRYRIAGEKIYFINSSTGDINQSIYMIEDDQLRLNGPFCLQLCLYRFSRVK